MNKFEFKKGHEDAQIPYPYIKGGVVNNENCTDEIVETIQKKFPHLAHNFVEAGTQEDYTPESQEPKGDLTKEDLKAMLLALTVPKIKAEADKMGIVIEGNPNKEELVNQVLDFIEKKKADSENSNNPE